MKSLLIGLSIALISVALDQLSKIYVFDLLNKTPNSEIELLPFLNFVKVYNTGVSFGMFNQLENGRLILSIFAILITLGLCIWLFKAETRLLITALGLIIGGAVGNIIDRVRVGAVADFIDIHAFGYHWPAFNIADSSIFIGAVILILDGFINKEDDKKVENND